MSNSLKFTTSDTINLTLDDVFVFCIAVLYFSTSSRALFSLKVLKRHSHILKKANHTAEMPKYAHVLSEDILHQVYQENL